MQVNLTLLVACTAMIGCGVYLVLERSLTRLLVGLVLISNGINVAFLIAGGPSGESAFYGRSDPADMADPLPQALVLTAIVITLGTVAFMLAMAHRIWQLHGNDDVQDDVEDALIRRLATDDAQSDSYDASTSGQEEDVFEEESP